MAGKIIFNDSAVFKKNPDIQTVKTNEGVIISRGDLKDDTIYYLDNPVSCRIWKSIGEGKAIGYIKEELLSEYDVAENKLEDDIKKFTAELQLKKLIYNDRK